MPLAGGAVVVHVAVLAPRKLNVKVLTPPSGDSSVTTTASSASAGRAQPPQGARVARAVRAVWGRWTTDPPRLRFA